MTELHEFIFEQDVDPITKSDLQEFFSSPLNSPDKVKKSSSNKTKNRNGQVLNFFPIPNLKSLEHPICVDSCYVNVKVK